MIDESRDQAWEKLFENMDLGKWVELQSMMGPDSPRLNAAREIALKSCAAHRETLEQIPLGLAFTRNLNGKVVKSPQNEYVIVLDMGVIYVGYSNNALWNCILSYVIHQPLLTTHSLGSLFAAIINLAKFSKSGNLNMLLDDSITHEAVLVQDPTRFIEGSLGYEVFTILHEYGHVILGHLNLSEEQLDRCYIDRDGNSHTLWHVSEFHADEFALIHMCKIMTGEVAMYWLCQFFRFLQLCEIVEPIVGQARTHPPAEARWKRLIAVAVLKGLLPSDRKTMAQHLDGWAQVLIQAAATGADLSSCTVTLTHENDSRTVFDAH